MITIPSLEGQKIAVFGLAKSGQATVNTLRASGAEIYAWDDSKKGQKSVPSGVSALPYANFPWPEIALLVLSPGVPLTQPVPHPIVKEAKKVGCPIICDIELLWRAQGAARYVGVTGTNGKSTTTTLTGHIFREAGKPVAVGGNLGVPALELEPLAAEGTYVLEMSSYQLDLIDQTHFSVGILLNITPDHLDRHGNMDGYIAAKRRMFKNQNYDDVAIIGVDDEHCRRLYEQLKAEGIVGRLIPISVERKVAGGVAVIDGVLYNGISAPVEAIELGALKYLPGKHNAQNIAAAFAASIVSGVDAATAVAAIRSFKGLKHRMELVAEIGNVLYVNDSKATNAEAAEKALVSYPDREIYWIAGGKPKDGGIQMLEPLFPKIKHAFLLGEAEADFAATLGDKVAHTRCGTLQNAFAEAARMAANAKGKAVVLLSPACASFDQFTSFEQRGDMFCGLVKEAI